MVGCADRIIWIQFEYYSPSVKLELPHFLSHCTLCSSTAKLFHTCASGGLLPLGTWKYLYPLKCLLVTPHWSLLYSAFFTILFLHLYCISDTGTCLLQVCLSHSTRSFLRLGATSYSVLYPSPWAHGWPSLDVCETEKMK